MKKLDRFGHKESQYERPQQKWICGHSDSGHACQLGPDKRGNCRKGSECSPVKKGERWHCTRSEIRGGKCTEGPRPDGSCCRPIPPCQPRRSLRSMRGLVTWCLIALSLGLIAIAFSNDSVKDLISPGELGFQHGAVVDGCAGCHSQAVHPGVNLVQTAIVGASGIEDSKLCLGCHKLGQESFRAHNLSVQELKHSSDKVKNHLDKLETKPEPPRSLALLSAVFGGNRPNNDATLACATCHLEHRGKEFNLEDMGNERCQTCHASAFKSFADGHPKFDKYPYARRTPIIFDHSEHFRYFAGDHKDKAPGSSCNTCHHSDSTGTAMLTGEFSKMCSNCHVNDITGEKSKEVGIPFITVPALDLETLAERGVSVGQWPANADAEEDLSQFLKVLLSTNPKVPLLLAKLKDLDLRDLSEQDDEVLAAVGLLAWELKSFLFDLYNEKEAALSRRFAALLNRDAQFTEVADLSAHLPLDLARDSIDAWFPNLGAEVRLFRANRAVPIFRMDAEDLAESESEPVESWYQTERWFRRGFSLMYQPIGHADNFLKSWLDYTSNSGPMVKTPYADELFLTLSDRKGPGACGKCHSVDAINTGTSKVSDTEQIIAPILAINWLTNRPEPFRHRFTIFSHKTHFSLLDQSGCQKCHSINDEADYLARYEGNDPMVGESRFATMNKDSCASCHTEKDAGSGCLKCHNYHIGNLPPAAVAATLPGFMAAPSTDKE